MGLLDNFELYRSTNPIFYDVTLNNDYIPELKKLFKNRVNNSFLNTDEKNRFINNFNDDVVLAKSMNEADSCFKRHSSKFYMYFIQQIDTNFKFRININDVNFGLKYSSFCNLLNKEIKKEIMKEFDNIIVDYVSNFVVYFENESLRNLLLETMYKSTRMIENILSSYNDNSEELPTYKKLSYYRNTLNNFINNWENLINYYNKISPKFNSIDENNLAILRSLMNLFNNNLPKPDEASYYNTNKLFKDFLEKYQQRFYKYVNTTFLTLNECKKIEDAFDYGMVLASNKIDIILCFKKHLINLYKKLINEINRMFDCTLQINESDYKLSCPDFYKMIKNILANSLTAKTNKAFFSFQKYPNFFLLENLLYVEKNKALNEIFKKMNKLDSDKLPSEEDLIDYNNLIDAMKTKIKKIIENYPKYLSCLNSLMNSTDDTIIKDTIKAFIDSFNKNPDYVNADKLIAEMSEKIKINNDTTTKEETILLELKNEILSKGYTKKENNATIFELPDLAAIYYEETDTMNILLSNQDNPNEFIWLTFSSKFNVVDDGMYQQATAVWINSQDKAGFFDAWNLTHNNMLLTYKPWFNYNSGSPIGTYKQDKENVLCINILDYELKIELNENYCCSDAYNLCMAILAKKGIPRPDNGQFFKYICRNLDQDSIKRKQLNMSKNHFPFENILIEKKYEKDKVLSLGSLSTKNPSSD